MSLQVDIGSERPGIYIDGTITSNRNHVGRNVHARPLTLYYRSLFRANGKNTISRIEMLTKITHILSSVAIAVVGIPFIIVSLLDGLFHDNADGVDSV